MVVEKEVITVSTTVVLRIVVVIGTFLKVILYCWVSVFVTFVDQVTGTDMSVVSSGT